jgi:hypothetical protein
VVAEVDRLSDERAAAIDNRPRARAAWIVLALWWAGFVVYRAAYPGVIGSAVGAGMSDGSVDPLQARLVVIAVNLVVLLVVAGSAAMAAMLVHRIDANQERVLAAYPAFVVR